LQLVQLNVNAPVKPTTLLDRFKEGSTSYLGRTPCRALRELRREASGRAFGGASDSVSDSVLARTVFNRESINL